MVSFGIPEIDWKSLALPFAYILVLGVSLYTFSTIYRKRKAGTSSFSPSPALLRVSFPTLAWLGIEQSTAVSSYYAGPPRYCRFSFSLLYVLCTTKALRQRDADPLPPAQHANLAPWFGPHLQRNVYLSLLHMNPEDGKEKSPKVPESVVRAALLRRAVEDIHRLVQIRTAKQACSSLLQKGSVGDDLWQRFQRAEKEMEEELRDVVMEVRALGSWLGS